MAMLKPIRVFLLLPFLLNACSWTEDAGGPLATVTASSVPTVATAAPPESTATFVPSTRYFQENFNADPTGWKIIVTHGEPGLLDLRVQAGAWVFDLGGTDLHAFALFQNEIYKNVRVDVRARNRGSTAYSLSLICRYNEEEGWYQYDIFNSGIYKLYYYVWDADQKAEPALLAEGVSGSILRGQQANEIGMVCSERDLILYVNGQLVNSFSENLHLLRDGLVGVGVSSYDELPIRLDLDWLKIRLP